MQGTIGVKPKQQQLVESLGGDMTWLKERRGHIPDSVSYILTDIYSCPIFPYLKSACNPDAKS